MILKSLVATHFRNIDQCEIHFAPGVNVLLGQNAQGKTNALECIYLFARGKSFRSVGDKELVQFGQKGFSAEISFFAEKREQTLSYRYYEGARRRCRNGAEVDKVSDMLGHFRAVLFSPDHLQLVKGSPEERRNFLNIAISQLDRSYIQHYAAFRRILDNRNYLLKNAQKGQYYDVNELQAWTEQLVEECVYITLARQDYIRRISDFAPHHMRLLSGEREILKLAYESAIVGETADEIKEGYTRAFEAGLKKELQAGCSLYGVHRDDLRLTLNDIDTRSFASQGQQRSVVLALKMAEGEVCQAFCGEVPVYLFDDVLSELDEKRRAYILSAQENRQTIVTSCEKISSVTAHTIEVVDGQFLPREV